jgi:LPXTG-motif cell wall-anchored protein
MKIVKTLPIVQGLALLLGVLASPARADQWNKESVLTFNQPVEIPGKVLPAGTYVFKLVDSYSWRHIVQVWNADKTRLLATILAVPNYQLEAKGETVINFHERPGDSPSALRAWFYPGDRFGQEFVYPKERAIQLAQASKEIVPAETVAPTDSNLKTVPLVAITPEKKEEPVTDAIQVLPLHAPDHIAAATAQPLKPEKLPQTGSSIPTIGLLGFAALVLGLGLKLLVKQFS